MSGWAGGEERGEGGEEMTEKKFKAYVRVQESGLTNMWDATRVCSLSGGILTRADVLDIIQNYDAYAEKWK